MPTKNFPALMAEHSPCFPLGRIIRKIVSAIELC
jgi:hypothetical protein